MFSGIVDCIGLVASANDTPGARKLVIDADRYWDELTAGASVAVDGVCLTLTGVSGAFAEFDVVAETLRRTTLGRLCPGDAVNLQKSLAVGDRLDGHFVQGHVDAVATVARVEESEIESKWWFSLSDADALACIVPKGSVAIDGISLTIADVRNGLFSVALIPTTIQRTTLGRKKVGTPVNIETDILARTVIHHLKCTGSGGA